MATCNTMYTGNETSVIDPYFPLIHTKAFIHTRWKLPLHLHTLRAVLCRHNVIVGGVSSEFLRENDDGQSTPGVGGGVPVDQVGVGRVCTIVNGAGVPWLNKYALHNGT